MQHLPYTIDAHTNTYAKHMQHIYTTLYKQLGTTRTYTHRWTHIQRRCQLIQQHMIIIHQRMHAIHNIWTSQTNRYAHHTTTCASYTNIWKHMQTHEKSYATCDNNTKHLKTNIHKYEQRTTRCGTHAKSWQSYKHLISLKRTLIQTYMNTPSNTYDNHINTYLKTYKHMNIRHKHEQQNM